MKYTLGACKHFNLESWGRDIEREFYTCMACFRRFQTEGENGRHYKLTDAPPWDGQCLHLTSFLKPISTRVNRTTKDQERRAFCMNCGCVLEHPAGKGNWTPVLFYGYVIHEEW